MLRSLLVELQDDADDCGSTLVGFSHSSSLLERGCRMGSNEVDRGYLVGSVHCVGTLSRQSEGRSQPRGCMQLPRIPTKVVRASGHNG